MYICVRNRKSMTCGIVVVCSSTKQSIYLNVAQLICSSEASSNLLLDIVFNGLMGLSNAAFPLFSITIDQVVIYVLMLYG